MKTPKIPKRLSDEDFDTMLDIGAKLRREKKREHIEAAQEQLREEGENDAE